MTSLDSTPTVILIAGHWLGAWAWDDVLEHLETDRCRAVAMTLPGLDPDDPDRTTRTLDDQVSSIADTVSRLDISPGRRVTLVAHSGANGPVTLFLDRHPELVHRMVWVDSGPVATGSAFAADFSAAELPLPPFDVLAQQASLDGLSPAALDRFRDLAVPEPGSVLRQTIELTNAARRAVPTTLVCCSFPSAQVLEMARGGHPMFAEVAVLESLEVVDLPTGHWPMWSRAGDLAEVIEEASASGNT